MTNSAYWCSSPQDSYGVGKMTSRVTIRVRKEEEEEKKKNNREKKEENNRKKNKKKMLKRQQERTREGRKERTGNKI